MADLYFLGNVDMGQMMGFVVKTKGKIIVIDGGSKGDYIQLAELLKKEGQSHVDGWFFTHADHDHTGSFSEICKNEPDILVDKVYCNFPAFEDLYTHSRVDWETELWKHLEELFSGQYNDKLCVVQKGDAFEFDEVKITILRVYNPDIKENFINNSSCVFRIDTPNSSVLILGDLGIEGGREVMENCFQESLHTEYTQMAHHGQAGVDEEFYKFIKPKRCFWAAPAWLWDNNNGLGVGSGPWQTLETRKWMENLGVKEHFVEKDGTIKIEI